jgi:HSP20 family molecular chaperone IbpA
MIMAERRVMQCACYAFDDQAGRLLVEVELPGGEKRNITINLGEPRYSARRFVKG